LANIINTYLGNIKMEIFILIGIVLAGLVALVWYKYNKNTKVEEAVIEPKSFIEPEVVPTVVVKEEPVQAKVEEISFTIEETSVVPEVIPEVVPEVVPEVAKPKAKPKRAKVNGKFVKDDPATPENEAWEGGVAPPKKPKAPPKPKRTRKSKA
jgi:hypothetical protein